MDEDASDEESEAGKRAAAATREWAEKAERARLRARLKAGIIDDSIDDSSSGEGSEARREKYAAARRAGKAESAQPRPYSAPCVCSRHQVLKDALMAALHPGRWRKGWCINCGRKFEGGAHTEEEVEEMHQDACGFSEAVENAGGMSQENKEKILMWALQGCPSYTDVDEEVKKELTRRQKKQQKNKERKKRKKAQEQPERDQMEDKPGEQMSEDYDIFDPDLPPILKNLAFRSMPRDPRGMPATHGTIKVYSKSASSSSSSFSAPVPVPKRQLPMPPMPLLEQVAYERTVPKSAPPEPTISISVTYASDDPSEMSSVTYGPDDPEI